MKYVALTEWLRWRREGITGTDASIIMGATPQSWGTISGLWFEKTGRKVDQKKQTARMRRGLRLEPVAREEYQRRTGVMVPDRLVENIKNPILRSSLDGLNHKAGIVWENKCPNADDHADAKAGRIPDKYLWQCVHHLMVTELPTCHYNSFDGKKGETVEFKRDLALEARLYAKEMWFWDLVVRDVPPPREAPSSNEKKVLGEGAKIFTLRRIK